MIGTILWSIVSSLFKGLIGSVTGIWEAIFGSTEDRLRNQVEEQKKQEIELKMELAEEKTRRRLEEEKETFEEKWGEADTRKEKYDLLKDGD